MSQDIMMQLGDVQFTISTLALESMSRSKTYRYTSQDTLGAGVVHQYMGRGLETYAVDAVLFAKGLRSELGRENDNGVDLAKLDALAASGKPAPLYDGMGKNHGNWVIQSIGESGDQYTLSGQLLKTKVRLELSRVEGK
jgi:phage protein U